MALECWL